MLEYNQRYPIGEISKCQGNVDIFLWMESEIPGDPVPDYDLEVCFAIFEDSEEWFKQFDPKGVLPLGCFYIQGDVKVPVPIEVTTRLSLPSK